MHTSKAQDVRNTHLHLTDCHKFLPTMEDESVDLICTDPPYGIDYQSNRRKCSPQHAKIAGDNTLDWLEQWSTEMFRVLKNNRHLYVFTRWDVYPAFAQALSRAGFTLKNCLIWIDSNHGSGDLDGQYAPQAEWIIFAHKGRRLLFGEKRPNEIIFCPSEQEDKKYHPTPKPVQLLRELIQNSTVINETVFDPFAGSGSTAVACLHCTEDNMIAPRNFIGCELNYGYHIIAQQRIHATQAQTELL